MKTYRTDSSVIHAVRFTANRDNPRFGTLRVWFNSRSVYDYLDVPESVAELLTYRLVGLGKGGALLLTSTGRVYNMLIKGQYRCIKRYGYRVPRWT